MIRCRQQQRGSGSCRTLQTCIRTDLACSARHHHGPGFRFSMKDAAVCALRRAVCMENCTNSALVVPSGESGRQCRWCRSARRRPQQSRALPRVRRCRIMIVSTKNTPVVELMSLALGRRRESLICSGEDGGDEADQADRADRPDFGSRKNPSSLIQYSNRKRKSSHTQRFISGWHGLQAKTSKNAFIH